MADAARPITPGDASFAAIWQQVGEEMTGFIAGVRDVPILPAVDPDSLRAELSRRFMFTEPIGLAELTAQVSGLLRGGIVHVTSPRYFGLYNPSVLEAGVVGDALVAIFNPQLAVWSHAPVAQEIERLVLMHFARKLGLASADLHASFASGGAEANLSGVLAALADRFPGVDELGAAALPSRPRIYLSTESHHSFHKIARMAGLGTRALQPVRTTDRLAMDPDALEQRIQRDLRSGFHPFLVVATAGTTSSGAVDPLPEIERIARSYGLWLHVDAAWGGAAVLSARLRSVLVGVEGADSVTWDAHKWLSVPMGAGMFFCRHPDAVRRAFAVSASYMPPAVDGEVVDPYATTAQWSRRLIGLKVFMALAHLGDRGYENLIERQTLMGERLREGLDAAGWSIVNDTLLPVVCFTHPDIRAGRITTAGVLRTIYERARVWISDAVLGEQERVLRACITSHRTDEDDIACLLEELEIARSTAAAAPRAPG